MRPTKGSVFGRCSLRTLPRLACLPLLLLGHSSTFVAPRAFESYRATLLDLRHLGLSRFLEHLSACRKGGRMEELQGEYRRAFPLRLEVSLVSCSLFCVVDVFELQLLLHASAKPSRDQATQMEPPRPKPPSKPTNESVVITKTTKHDETFGHSRTSSHYQAKTTKDKHSAFLGFLDGGLGTWNPTCRQLVGDGEMIPLTVTTSYCLNPYGMLVQRSGLGSAGQRIPSILA